MRLRRVWPILAVFLLSAASAAAADIPAELAQAKPRVRLVNAIDDSQRVILTGNRHPKATPDHDIGAVQDDERFTQLILSLKSDRDQQAALEKYLGSERRDGRLTPAEFGRHFGVAQADLDRIRQWLTAHGFAIDQIAAGRRAIIFSGTAAQIRSAFHTSIHRYSIDGKIHQANDSEPEIPAALADLVGGVVGLNDFRRQPLHDAAQAEPNYTSGGTHYLSAGDYGTIYHIAPLYAAGITGQGRSIAILGRTDVDLGDIQQFRSAMNLPANTPQVIVNGTDPGYQTGDEQESDLDLEWAGAVAPGATIKFVTSANSATADGIDLSAQYAVNNNVADIISLSYGSCEKSMGKSGVGFYDNLWQQAAAQGMTVLVSSGDSGAAGCDAATASTATHGQGVNGLCSSSYSTCVGGARFDDTANPSLYWSSSNGSGMTSALSYIPELVWNESGSNGGSGLWATGGGASIYISKPAWQTTPGVPADGKRDVPDVALNAAAHDGYLGYSSDNSTRTRTLYVFSGTSASAPAFAGLIALVNQKTGYRQGNANPALYGLANLQANNGVPAVFHQITSGNNSVPGVTGFSASTAAPAYNQATGLGSVDANTMVSHWTDLLPASGTSVASGANPIVAGAGVTFTAAVTGTAPTGTVSFLDGGTSLGAAVTLSNGTATFTTAGLGAGSHSITASYSGDPGNRPSVSAVLTQIVQAQSGVALSAAAASVPAGQPVTFTAVVSGASPTGTVQLKDGTANIGAPVALVNSTATFNASFATAGSHAVTAAYAGDAYNAASVSPQVTETVTPASSSVTATASVYSANVGDSVTLTATVSGASPTGTVQFLDGGANLGAAAALNNGVATLVTTALASGQHAISAHYGGDANNQPGSAAAIAVTVTNGAANVPTLPQWAALLLGVLLAARLWRVRSSR